MLGVKVDGFCVEGGFVAEIDDGVGAVDAFEREKLGEFREGEDFAVVFGRPAEEAEKVDEGAGEEAGVAVGGDADDGAVFALGKLCAVGSDEQGQVRELGRGRAEGFKDEEMLEGVGEVILAANDVGDAKVGIVDAGGQVVGGIGVGSQEGEVFYLVGQLRLVAVDTVGEAEGAV